MRTIISILMMIFVISISSCTVIGTLYPITVDSKDFVIKNELIGKWWDAGDSSYYFNIDTLPGFNGQYFKVYAIEVDVENKFEDTTSFTGILTNFDDWYFFEYWYDMKEDMEGLVLPMHFVVRLSFPSNNKIEFSNIDADALLKLIDQKKIHLTYAKRPEKLKYNAGYDYLILDKTPVLRKALIETKKYPKVYQQKKSLVQLKGSLF